MYRLNLVWRSRRDLKGNLQFAAERSNGIKYPGARFYMLR